MRTAIVTKFLAVSFFLTTSIVIAVEPEAITNPTQGKVVATGLKSKGPSRASEIPGQTMPLINDPKSSQDLLSAYQIQLDPPGAERLFRLESEDSLRERMGQEKKSVDQLERLVFPSDVVLSTKKYDYQWRNRNWARHDRKVEPFYLTYDRLFFHEINSERYGWDLGAVQPFVSTLTFFYDFVTLPYHMATDPFRRYDSSSGYCLPGDPVPYMWYPPNVSVTGTVSELLTIALLVAVFP
ncbi:MAG: hypothetical protein RL179_173 [Planctomycetota bacterium]|jgi:hypothetical protein